MPTIDVEQQRRDARRAYLNFLSLKRSSRQRGDRGNLLSLLLRSVGASGGARVR